MTSPVTTVLILPVVRIIKEADVGMEVVPNNKSDCLIIIRPVVNVAEELLEAVWDFKCIGETRNAIKMNNSAGLHNTSSTCLYSKNL